MKLKLFGCVAAVRHLNWRVRTRAINAGDAPVHDLARAAGLMPRDLCRHLSTRRDCSNRRRILRFEEFKARYGTTAICGWADHSWLSSWPDR